MANIKSQKKRIITNEKARLRNRAVKSELKTATRRVKDAIAAENGAEAYAAAMAACRLLDKAASKGVIHKNQAANRKNGVMLLVKDVTAADRAAYVKPVKKAQNTGSKKAAAKAEREAAMKTASAEKAKRREKTQKDEATASKRKAKEAEEAAKAEAAEAAAKASEEAAAE